MPIKKVNDFAAYQLAVDFKLRIYKLVDEHPRAKRDFQYTNQLLNAAGGVDSKMAEGWARFGAAEIRQFLRYSLGSLEEAKGWIRDGIARGYFTQAECEELLVIGNRCGAATMAWWKSLGPFVKSHGRGKPQKRPERRKPTKPQQ